MILIITGHLAYPLVKQMADKSSKETIVHIADTQVAAFLTPSKIIKEIKENYSDILEDIELILVPGLIRKDTFEIAEALKIPCYKASTDAADLAMVLDLVDDLCPFFVVVGLSLGRRGPVLAFSIIIHTPSLADGK